MKSALILNDTSVTNHYGCVAVMQNIESKLYEVGIKPTCYWPVSKDWRPHSEKLKRLNFDCVIVNGEGSIHHSSIRKRACILSEIAPFAKYQLQVPAYIINATVYDNAPDVYQNIKLFQRVYVRESMSQEILHREGIHSKIVPDLSMAFPHSVKSSAPKVSGLVTDSVDQNTTSVLKTISKNFGWTFASMKKNNIFSENKIYQIVQKIQKDYFILPFRYSSRTKIHTKVSFSDFIDRLTSSKCVITGRFHTVAFCILTQTPFIALESNTPKISAFVNDVLKSDNRIMTLEKLHSLEKGEVLSRFGYFSENETASIVSYLKNGFEEIDCMFSMLIKDLEQDRP